MSKQTAPSFFIVSPCEANSAGLYQVLSRGVDSYQQFGGRLIRLAEQTHALRQFDRLKEIALMLSNVPVKGYEAVGHYFLAVATHRRAKGDEDVTRKLLESAVDKAPDAYKLQAILSLSALSFRKGDFGSTLYYFQETLKAQSLGLARIQAIKGISILKAIEGNHRQAVEDLESILPVVKYTPAHVYFDILNSYAVELGEVGRVQEARNVSRRVLASPLAFAYPEWRETAEDLRPSSRSVVALDSSPYNVLTLPGRECDGQPATQPRPARVLSFAKWKKTMAKKEREKERAEKERQREFANMSVSDMGFKLLEIIAHNRPDYFQMRAILDFTLRILSAPDGPPDEPPA